MNAGGASRRDGDRRRLPLLFEGVLYNAMGLLAGGKLVGLVAKENLATGDVEYENRYFTPWPHGRLVDYRGPDGTIAPLGHADVRRCRGWAPSRSRSARTPGRGSGRARRTRWRAPRSCMNPSASWFTIGKHRARRRMVEQISREDHCVYMYTSLLGCDATRLIFDGSLFLADERPHRWPRGGGSSSRGTGS